jgi:hypothetical protein
MKWLEIINRDRLCIYCGSDEFGLLVISLDANPVKLAGNSAAACKICCRVNARKALGKRGARVFIAEIQRKNNALGIDNFEVIESSKYHERVSAGLHKFKLPRRDYHPHKFNEEDMMDDTIN